MLATPKTGTTAIAAALEPLAAVAIQRPPTLKHTTVHRYHRFLHPYLAAASGAPFSVVALMREPQDWLGSWYRYRQREGITDAKESTSGISFDEFVQAYCRDDPPDFANVGSQERFLRPRQGLWLDHLFRYENIAEFVQYLEEKLEFDIILAQLNVSPAASLELSVRTEALLHDFAARDFEMYKTLRPCADPVAKAV